MHNKVEITRAVLELCSKESNLSFGDAMHEWWQDPRDTAGLRLSPQGFMTFVLTSLEHYKFDLPQDIHKKGRTLLTLDRKMTCPYFISRGRNPEIYIFGSKEASLFALYGDVQKFLRGIARQ